MEISILKICLILWIHTVSDFVLQPNYLAENKSKSNFVLSIHVIIYSVLFIVFFGWGFGLINGLLHFPVDWATSRLCKIQFEKGNKHLFFIIIGIDQAIHITILTLTYNLLII